MSEQSTPVPFAPSTPSGYVYLIAEQHGLVKIGKATDPDARLESLQAVIPYPLVLLLTIPAVDFHRLERELHQRFASLRVRGEWFRLSPYDIEALRREYSGGDPRPPTPRSRCNEPLTADEADRLLAGASSLRDQALVLCFLRAGPSVSELCRLRVEDVDFAAATISFVGGKTRRPRLVPAPADLLAALRSFLGDRCSGPVFPSRPGRERLGSRAVQRCLKRVAARAGLTGAYLPRRISPGKLRHTFAAEELRTGTDIITVGQRLGSLSGSLTQAGFANGAATDPADSTE